jgi:predicted nucleotidyltransferase
MDSNRVLELREIVKSTGFEQADSLIHLFIGGSEAHGAKIAGTDDLDLYGIYIPAPSKALGIPESYPDENLTMVTEKPEHFVWSTADSKRRNGPDDVDFAAYSLRKWAGMAAKGNATALHFLFTPNLSFKPSSWEKHIRPNTSMFVSSWAGFHFKAFAEAQLRRLNGDAGAGKHGQRPELTEQFGYDTKSAMHIIRILGEGIELMKTGHITLPRPEKDFLIEIRKGQYGSLTRVKALAEEMFALLDDARRNSKLPEGVNRPAISKLVADTYLDFWTGGFWHADSKLISNEHHPLQRACQVT